MVRTRKQIESMANGGWCEHADLIEVVTQLLAENDALREDAERLDWMGDIDDGFYNIDRISADSCIGFWSGMSGRPKYENLREAIDAARKKG